MKQTFIKTYFWLLQTVIALLTIESIFAKTFVTVNTIHTYTIGAWVTGTMVNL